MTEHYDELAKQLNTADENVINKKMEIDECTEFLLKEVMPGFQDRSFKNYIENHLAGDFVYNLANHLKEKEIKRLREIKEWLISEISIAEPYDDQILDTDSEKMIHTWIKGAFENRIYDFEHSV